MKKAFYQTVARTLSLSPCDIAEIGGWRDDSFARRIMRGSANFPQDVKSALLDLQGDVDAIADILVSQCLDGYECGIFVFKTNKQLRDNFPNLPCRGDANGGFVGVYNVAAIKAKDILLRKYGIKVDILFFHIQTN